MHPSRRALLRSLVAVPLSSFAAETRAPKVTITGLEIFRVKVNRRGDWIIARLQTSAGVTGIGDASQSANDEQMVQFLRQFFEAIKGAAFTMSSIYVTSGCRWRYGTTFRRRWP